MVLQSNVTPTEASCFLDRYDITVHQLHGRCRGVSSSTPQKSTECIVCDPTFTEVSLESTTNECRYYNKNRHYGKNSDQM